MMKFAKICIAASAISMSFGGAHAQDADTVLATVNGSDITLGHLIAVVDRLPQEYQSLDDASLFAGVLDQLIQQTSIAQKMEGQMDKIATLGLENERRAFMVSEYLGRIQQEEPSEEAITDAYNAQFADEEARREFNASHILVDTEEEALALIVSLEEGADFVELAKEKSTGPSGPSGGSLGWFGLGAMVPAFEQTVIDLEVGNVSQPVQTQFGWHVVKLNDSRVPEPPELADVRGSIVSELQQQRVTSEVDRINSEVEVVRSEVEIEPSLIRNIDLLSE